MKLTKKLTNKIQAPFARSYRVTDEAFIAET